MSVASARRFDEMTSMGAGSPAHRMLDRPVEAEPCTGRDRTSDANRALINSVALPGLAQHRLTMPGARAPVSGGSESRAGAEFEDHG